MTKKPHAPFTGKNHTEESKEKIAAGQRGRRRSTQTRERMSAAKAGVTKTEEHKRKISASLLSHFDQEKKRAAPPVLKKKPANCLRVDI